jgi:hypothetical protein
MRIWNLLACFQCGFKDYPDVDCCISDFFCVSLQANTKGCLSLGQAEIIPIKPDAGNADVGIYELLISHSYPIQQLTKWLKTESYILSIATFKFNSQLSTKKIE